MADWYTSYVSVQHYMQDQLRTAIENCSSENEAFVDTFGKDHPGYVRGMGLGVTPSQLTIPSFNRSTLQNDGLIEKMQSEIESLKEKAAEVDALKAQVAEMDVLKEQLAFLMQVHKKNGVKNFILNLLNIFIFMSYVYKLA